MNERDTTRIKSLLGHVNNARNLVREEIAAGASLQPVHDKLLDCEHIIGERLRELEAWNKRQATATKTTKAEAKAEQAAEKAEHAAEKAEDSAKAKSEKHKK